MRAERAQPVNCTVDELPGVRTPETTLLFPGVGYIRDLRGMGREG